MTTNKLETVNKLYTELGLFPLEIPNESVDYEQRYALAKMYSDKPMRDYLTRAIRLNASSLLDVVDINELSLKKGRILVLKELLSLGKQMFEETQKLEKKQSK